MPDREPRDVLGEALRVAYGRPYPAWPEASEDSRRMWCLDADDILAGLAEAGYRIVKEGD